MVIGNNGFMSLLDALLAVFLIFILLSAFNIVINTEIYSLSEESKYFKTSQDVMELLSVDLDGKDYSILEEISYILNISKNSKNSQKEVANRLKIYFDTYLNGFHYSFVEVNHLNGKEIISNGDRFEADNLTVATRNYGDYSYQLYLW